MNEANRTSTMKGVDYVLNLLENQLLKVVGGRMSAVKTVLFIFISSFIIHVLLFPGLLKNYYQFFTSYNLSDYDFLAKRSVGLREVYINNDISTFSHHYKLKYRLTLPLISNILGTSYLHYKIFFAEVLAGLLFIHLLFGYLKTYIEEQSTAFYLLLILSSTYVISAMRMDFSAYGDSIAFLFLLLAVSRSNPAELFLYSQIAIWTDERAAFALCTVVLFWWWKGKNFLTGQKRINVKQLAVIIFSLTLYGAVRLWMEEKYYLFDNNTNLSGNLIGEFVMTITENVKNLGFSIWRGYKGLAYFVPLAALFLWINGEKLTGILFSLIFAACIGFSFIAFDLSRSVTYFYLLPIFGVFFLGKYLTQKELKILLIITFLTTFINPDLTFFRFTTGFSIY